MLHEGEAMVADFGIALAVQEAAGERLTESGMSLGTPQYMSPEQATGVPTLTVRSDIFSLGAVVYEMLTGESPFRGRTPQATIARLITERPASIRTVRETVPAAVEAAVMRAMAKVPADRFSNAGAFATALREGMTSVPSGAVSAEPGGRRRLASPGRRLVASTVAAGLVLASVLVLSTRANRGVGASPASVSPPVSPLVLVSPFQTRGGDTAAASIARSLSGAIVDSLATIAGLRAVATTGDASEATDSLLRRAEISLIVGGSIERRGKELKAIGRVSDGASRSQIFSHAEAAPAGAAGNLGVDLVERVVRFIRRDVGTETRRRAVAAETQDSDAVAYWSRAMSIIDAISSPEASSLPRSSADRLAVADSLLGEAVHRDPRWIGPHIARGWASLESASLFASEGQRDTDRIAAQRKAMAAADAAIRIGPANPDAHELRGVALLGLWFEAPSDQADSIGQEAERELGRAISLDLNVARAWEALGTYYLLVGKFREARQAMSQAQEADAFLLSEPRILRWQILADLNLGRYEDARETCARGVRWYPLEPVLMNCEFIILGWSAEDVESAKRAWQLGRKAEDQVRPAWRRDTYRTNLLMTAAILARAGHRDSALSLLGNFERTRQGPEDLDGFAFDEAYVRLLVGQQDKALALLRTFLHHNWAQRGYVANTPWFRPLHGNPAFTTMTQRLPWARP
jgi:TolB-like protein